MTKPKPSFASRFREALRSENYKDEGLTCQTLGILFDCSSTYAYTVLREMPDTYIHDWVRHRANGQLMAVWKIAIPPPDKLRPIRLKRGSP